MLWYFKALAIGLMCAGLFFVGLAVRIATNTEVDPLGWVLREDQVTKAVARSEIKVALPPPLTVSISRPLFRPDRRPFVVSPIVPVPESLAPVLPEPAAPVLVEESVPPPPPPTFPQVTLRGIHRTAQVDSALVESAAFPQGQWMHVNDEVEGWQIKSISDDAIIFTLGRQIQSLKLYVDNPANSIGNPPP
jgi:hypothetical protein